MSQCPPVCIDGDVHESSGHCDPLHTHCRQMYMSGHTSYYIIYIYIVTLKTRGRVCAGADVRDVLLARSNITRDFDIGTFSRLFWYLQPSNGAERCLPTFSFLFLRTFVL